MTFTEAKERARAFGVYGAISGGGAAIGLVVGGILTEYASWRWCLFVNIPIAFLAAALAVPFVHESKADGDTRYDIPGAVTATLGLVALVYGFTKVGELKPGVRRDRSARGERLALVPGVAVLPARGRAARRVRARRAPGRATRSFPCG